MIVINEEKYFEKKEEIINFIIQNSDKYGEYFSPLLDALNDDIPLEFQNQNPLLIRQLFSKFELYKEGKDEYQIILDLLESYGFLTGNCCEVGAGFYPRLSELVIKKLHVRNYHLTIYEPNIMFDNFKAKIIKESFTKESNITNIQNLFALYPCEATITIAEKAFEEDKNLLLACCGCDHSTKQHPKGFSKYWAEDFCMDYKEKYGDKVKIINWPSHINNDFPIMVRKMTNKRVNK